LTTGPPPDLLAGTKVPIELTAQMADTTRRLEGEAAKLMSDPEFAVTLKLEAPSLAAWQILSEDMPEIAPLDLSAQLQAGPAGLDLQGLAANFGPSDLSGAVALAWDGERPKLSGELTSDVLDLAALTADEASGNESAPSAAEDDSESPYIFDETALPFDLLGDFDADLGLKVASLTVHEDLTVRDVDIGIKIADRHLEIAPFSVQSDKGNLEGRLQADATQEPPAVSLSARADNLELEAGENLRMIVAAAYDVESKGHSLREIASNLTGRHDVISRQGYLDSRSLGLLTFGAEQIINPFFGGKDRTAFHCMVLRLDSEGGVATAKVITVDTEAFTIAGDGTIDLRDETLNLSFGTKAHTLSLARLAAPFVVTGTLKRPVVNANPIGSVAKAGGAAVAVVNPAAVAGLVFGGNILNSNKVPCQAAFELLADTRAPADLTTTDADKRQSTGVVGEATRGVTGTVESIGKGIGSIFGGGE
jgi:uncharacterized protein involved in outer membrane biogenesis